MMKDRESNMTAYSGGMSTSYAGAFDMNRYLKDNTIYRHGNPRYPTEH